MQRLLAILLKIEPFCGAIGVLLCLLAVILSLHYARIYIPLILGVAFILLSRYLAGKKPVS